MALQVPGSIFCFWIYRAENHSLAWLAVQNNCAIRGCNHQRDHREILFTINDNGNRGMLYRVLKRAYKIIGYGPGGIFHPDTLSMDCGHPATWRAHGTTINNSDCGIDTYFLEIMGNDITDGIYDTSRNFRENLVKVPVQFSKGLPKKFPVLFWKRKHQRTFRA